MLAIQLSKWYHGRKFFYIQITEHTIPQAAFVYGEPKYSEIAIGILYAFVLPYE